MSENFGLKIGLEGEREFKKSDENDAENEVQNYIDELSRIVDCYL